MTRWLLLAALLVGTWGLESAEAGGFFRGRVIGGAVPGTYGAPVETYSGRSVAIVPSAYAVPNSAAYPTGYVLPGTTYSRGYSTAPVATPGPELINPNPPVRPYSYYVAQPVGTARGYYGFGDDQFPFYGRPYGHPYDPWTWPYMTDAYNNSLYHYYHAPIP